MSNLRMRFARWLIRDLLLLPRYFLLSAPDVRTIVVPPNGYLVVAAPTDATDVDVVMLREQLTTIFKDTNTLIVRKNDLAFKVIAFDEAEATK